MLHMNTFRKSRYFRSKFDSRSAVVHKDGKGIVGESVKGVIVMPVHVSCKI